MSLPNTYFTKSKGGLLKTLPSKDPISGLIFYNDNVPTTWAENSTGDVNWATSTAYLEGDIVYDSVTKSFYIAKSDHTSDGSSFANDLSSNLWILKSEENIRLIRRMSDLEDLGILEGSVNFSFEYYQVSEFFRLNSNGYLYISINPTPGAWNFNEVYNLQNAVNGDIRQVGVFANIAFNVTEITSLQAIAEKLSSEYMPLSILYSADFTGISDITTVNTLRTLQAPKVSVVIGMDGSGKGYELYESEGYTIPALGATLGAVSLVKVSESIASPELINFSSSELDLPLFGNGERVKDLSVTDLEDLYDKGYIFFKKFNGDSGTYAVDDLTATDELSDYFDIKLNRVIDKAIRLSREALLPKLHSKVATTATGNISPVSISLFKDVVSAPLVEMKSDNDIVDFVVEIDPNQNILQDSTLNIVVRIRPYGVARFINVNIGFAVSF